MLRQLASSARRAAPRAVRAFADDAGAGAAGADGGAASRAAFLEKIKPLLSSTSAPPSFLGDFVPKTKGGEEGAEAATPAAGGVPDKLTFSCYLPHGQPVDREPVDLVLLPAVSGDFGVMPGHVPTVAQLRPGVMAVHTELDKQIQKYFVSAGFAFVHADSTAEVCAVEAVPLADLDPDAVRAGLADATAKLAAVQGKGDDLEIAAAQVGVEVYSAMAAAVGS